MPGLFHRLPQNLLASFRGWNLAWHALAIGLTILIVTSDFDWTYYCATRSGRLEQLAEPAIRLGGLLPLFLPPALLLAGVAVRRPRLIAEGWALWQAALLGWLVSSTCKAFTGRLPPPWRFSRHFGLPPDHGPLTDSSHGFQLGFLKGGIFWGWPSSHTTVAFAMAVCLVAQHPRRRWLAVAALAYALWVGLSVSLTIHWFSEFVAGAIIGSVIGSVVGHSPLPAKTSGL